MSICFENRCLDLVYENIGKIYALLSQYYWKIVKDTGFAVTIEALSKVSEQFGIAASEDNQIIVVMMIEKN